MRQRRAVLIAGPTASGKSALALRLAERLGGTVINADSMAVYRDLRILTGRPEPHELTRAPHRLYGHRDAAEPYSVASWLGEADLAIGEARRLGRVPIVVGGTGLYLRALVAGLSEIPAVPHAIRDRLRREATRTGSADLHARLASVDPETASRLRPTDPQRVLRALEVYEATGRPLSAYHAARQPPRLPEGSFLGLVIDTERAGLRDAIDRRFDAMLAAGALDEVRDLVRRRLDPALPAMRALGVRPLLSHLAGDLSLDDAADRARAETRAYAKRQVTFARHQLPSFDWVDLVEAERRGALA